jgi:disulfide bond formation protein DsbB
VSGVAQTLTTALAALTAAGQAFVLAALAALVLAGRSSGARTFVRFVGRYALALGLAVAAAGVGGSLYYSEIAGFLPCTLCWVQRILLYPQVVMFGWASLRRDLRVMPLTMAFSAAGLAVALYQYYLQLGGSPLVPCASGGVSCSLRFFWEFGYISMPLMSATAFAILLVLGACARRSRPAGLTSPPGPA